MARHLLVTNDFPPKTGGIQAYLYELWRRLENGRAVVLTASSDPGAAAFDAGNDLVIERVASSTLYLPTLGALRAIEAAISRHDPDLVLLDPAWPLGLRSRDDCRSSRRRFATCCVARVWRSVPVPTARVRLDASPPRTCHRSSRFPRASIFRVSSRST